jgi:hypothetical protein
MMMIRYDDNVHTCMMEWGTVLARSAHEIGGGVGEGYATWHCLGPFTVFLHYIIS